MLCFSWWAHTVHRLGMGLSILQAFELALGTFTVVTENSADLGSLYLRFLERKVHLCRVLVNKQLFRCEWLPHFSLQSSATQISTTTGASGPSTSAIPSSIQR